MSIPYVVISLKGSKALDLQNLRPLVSVYPPLEIIGVNGSNLLASEYYKYVRNGTQPYLSPGEVGCALSHIKAYQLLVRAELDYLLVVEDDIIIQDGDFSQNVEYIANSIQGLSLCLLGGLEGLTAKYDLMGYQVERTLNVWSINKIMYRWCWRTCGYLISRDLAKHILRAQSTKISKADNWNIFMADYRSSIHYCPLIKHPTDLKDSLIESERSTPTARNSFIRKVVKFCKYFFKAYCGAVLGMHSIHSRK